MRCTAAINKRNFGTRMKLGYRVWRHIWILLPNNILIPRVIFYQLSNIAPGSLEWDLTFHYEVVDHGFVILASFPLFSLSFSFALIKPFSVNVFDVFVKCSKNMMVNKNFMKFWFYLHEAIQRVCAFPSLIVFENLVDVGPSHGGIKHGVLVLLKKSFDWINHLLTFLRLCVPLFLKEIIDIVLEDVFTVPLIDRHEAFCITWCNFFTYLIKFWKAIELDDAHFFALVEETNEEGSLALSFQKTQLSLFFTILLQKFGKSSLSLLHGQSDVPILRITFDATLSIIPFPGTFDTDIQKEFF